MNAVQQQKVNAEAARRIHRIRGLLTNISVSLAAAETGDSDYGEVCELRDLETLLATRIASTDIAYREQYCEDEQDAIDTILARVDENGEANF